MPRALPVVPESEVLLMCGREPHFTFKEALNYTQLSAVAAVTTSGK